METSIHRFSDLFAQLGLPTNGPAIRDFIAQHAPLDACIELHDAPFWQAAQSRMLQEMTSDDADWAELVDQLDVALRLGCAPPDAPNVATPDNPHFPAPADKARP